MNTHPTPQLDVARLRSRVASLEATARSLGLATWELALGHGQGAWSAEMCQLCGFEPATPASRAVLLAATHPDDRQALSQLIDALLEGPDERRVLVHRVVHSSGAVRWLESSLALERDAAGTPICVFGASRDRSAELQAQAAARESQEQLHELLQAIEGVGAKLPALFWLRDLDSRLTYANQRWVEQFGRPIEIGADYRQLFAAVHPEDVEWVSKTSDHHREGGFDEAIRMLDSQGAIKWLHVRTIGITDPAGRLRRVVGVGIDITDQVVTAHSLRDSEARYRSVVLAMTDGIVVLGPAGDIVTTNPSAERVLGLTADQLMGQTPLDPRWRVVHEDGSPFPGEQHPGWVTLETGKPLTGVIMGVHTPEGQLRWISVNSRRVTEPGEQGAYSVVASFTDITDRRVAEEKLQASLAEKEVLLREIHHRVKNNLQIISSLLYLQSIRTDSAAADLFRDSQSRVSSMALIHQMLYQSPDLSQIPFGAYVLDLGRSLARAHGADPERIRMIADAGDHVLGIDIAVPCGLLLNEILSNSFKHAFPNNRSGTILVELSSVDQQLRLVVSDDGVGLPMDFEARRSTSLGSKLIERLGQQIGGVIQRSDPGQPTRYELCFPVARGPTGSP